MIVVYEYPTLKSIGESFERAKMPQNLNIKAIVSQGNWVDYDNGNYHVWLNLDDGTKIRHTNDDEFSATFPESMDIKISNACDMGCPMCHENSTINGSHADIEQSFLDTLHPYQEIAVGGGNVLSHPELEKFLRKLKDLKCVPSITINQVHFMRDFERVKRLYDDGLVYGVGVSLTDANQDDFIERLHEIPSSVIHTIVGILSADDVKSLAGKDVKILLLGYKDLRRGHDYISSSREVANQIERNRKWVAVNLPMMIKAFSVLSFDNLALEQLPVRQIVGEDVWETFYMGDDGNHTFYIDMVEREFARSSTSTKRHRIEDKSIDEMFAQIAYEKKQENNS